ncbi:hypothetical protein BW731_11085 [Vagococcus martis]|uniref:WxL domain-containing protein n=1 Tax=Vagococcus martis TaxID=1768210 RepID=A0A1V4DJQ1_9ENTE|nr:WxL domain-containing protein [Vagococcus martis]OPF88669.1 hypothetical protein BW731_11085 [Vagococcus martis]
MRKSRFTSRLLLVLASAMFVSVSVGAETALDKAPEINASSVAINHKKVLFDNTHGQTAGAADWVIDGAFSDFANALANKGYFVKELRKTTPITLDDLKEYDVFVLPEANIPYKVGEQQAIADYVSQGGAVFYIADHYNADRNKNRIDSSEAFNGYRRGAYHDMTKDMSAEEKNSDAMKDVKSSDWLSDTFGIRFRYNALDNIDNNKQEWIIEEAFGITKDVKKVGLHAGSTLAITDNTRAKGLVYPPKGLTSAHKWGHAVDDGVYNGGGIEEGPYIAISKRDNGKAAFLGDTSLVEDASPKYLREENGKSKKTYDGFKEADDAKILMQLVNWLAEKETYKNFTQSDIVLSEMTKIHDYEQPEKTTEPQNEPWAAPQAGYKWFDSSTFAPGSFGSADKAPAQPRTTVVFTDKPVANQLNKATITMEGLTPNSEVKDYQFGVYTPTAQNGFELGNQVAKTKIADGQLSEKIGYSDKFSVKADSKGTASVEVSYFVEFDGEYNFRVKLGKNNVLTQSIRIEKESDTPPTPEDKPSLDYNIIGQIKFNKSDGVVKPVDPENPNDTLTPVNPDGTDTKPGTGGLLSIDYASNFSFGQPMIETTLKNYGAFAQRFKDSDVLRGNYVQVSDKRGSQAGWVLQIVQDNQFKSSNNDELTGAKLVLGNGNIQSPNMLQEGFDVKTMPVHTASSLKATDSSLTGGLELIPGQSHIVLKADKGQGMGTWVLSYGQSKDGNIGLLNDNTPHKSSVILSVPSTANPKEALYESSITYKLSMVPTP